MKNFEMVKQKKRMHIMQSGKNQLRHPGHALDLKAKSKRFDRPSVSFFDH